MRVLDVRHHHAHDVGPALAQMAGEMVGLVAEAGGHRQHPLPGLRLHPWRAIQHAGDGRVGHAGEPGDITDPKALRLLGHEIIFILP